MIFLCLEGFLFLTFTAVMFGTQIHSICNDETVKTSTFVCCNSYSRKMWLGDILFDEGRLLLWKKLKSSFLFSEVLRIEILSWGLLFSKSSYIICFSDVNFIIRFSITNTAQILTSVCSFTSHLSQTPDTGREKCLLFSGLHLN